MQKHLRLIPWGLLWGRLHIAWFFLILPLFPDALNHLRTLTFGLFIFGFLGDIADGIIARKLKMDTTLLRQLDSRFDALFWIGAAVQLWWLNPGVHETLLPGALAVLGVVGLEYGISWYRFRKGPSAHNLPSKIFGIFLFLWFVAGWLGWQGPLAGIFVFVLGVLARLDAVLIYLILPEWSHDIPSCIHAWKMRKGDKIKRNPLFHSTPHSTPKEKSD